MKRSEIYLRAAELIDSGRETFSCLSIPLAMDMQIHQRPDEQIAYEEMFGFSALYEPTTKNDSDIINRKNVAQSKLRRVLMLCLASAIAESEGD